jgi:hypothetical protein
MIVRPLIERGAVHPAQPRIADMKNVRRGPLNYHRGERADVTFVLVVRIGAAPRLREQP